VVGTAAVAAVVDWATKAVAAALLDDRTVELGKLLALRLSHNPGVAFGMGDRLPGPVVIALTAAVTVGLGVAAVRGILHPPAVAGLLLEARSPTSSTG